MSAATDLPALAELDAERALLGALMHLDVDQAGQLLEGLEPGDLAESRHRAVLEAVRRTVAAGQRADPVTVSACLLDRSGDVRFVGGDPRPLLADLYGAVPFVDAAPTYRRLVLEAAALRSREERHSRMRQALDRGDVEAFDELAAGVGTAPVPRGALQGLDLSTLSSQPAPPRWLVDGRLTERSLALLGAKPGVGKSWLAVDLALALVLGRPWLGHEVPTVRRVLYLDAENGQDLALRRLRQLGLRPDLAGGRLLYSTDLLLLDRAEDLARYSATLAVHRPDLVIVDTLASHAPSAEADTESSSRFLSEVWGRASASGAGLVLLHHLRKSLQGGGKDDPLDAFRGAGHLVGAASRAWVLRPLAGDGARFLLVDAKAREFSANDPVRVAVVDDQRAPAGDPRTTVVVEGIERTKTVREAFLDDVLAHLAALAGRPAKTADLVHIGLAIGASERSCKGWLTEAVAAGVLARAGRGAYQAAQDALPEPIEPDDDEPEETP